MSEHLTEEEIELSVERKIDAIDRKFMRGDFSAEEYDRKIEEVDAWSRRQLARRNK